MSAIEEKPKYWSFNELKDFYQNTPNNLRGNRLLDILRWARGNGALIVSKNVFPSFGIRGRHGKRIMSVWSPEISHPSMPPGTIYIFINPKTKFGGSLEEKDAFLEDLNRLTSLGFGDISDNVAGKNSAKTIDEQTEEEFSSFMEILSRYGYR